LAAAGTNGDDRSVRRTKGRTAPAAAPRHGALADRSQRFVERCRKTTSS